MNSIYVANQSAVSVAASGVVPLGTRIHQAGCRCTLNGNGITIKGQGMYKVDVSITATGTNLSFQLYKDGVAVTGAVATETGASATTFNLAFPALVLNQCCTSSVLTVVNIGAASTVDNIAMVVTRL